jgi:6-phosphofructokinase 1
MEETNFKGIVGILTGGGDCPGLNAVIRASCLALHSHGYIIYGLKDGFEGLYDANYIELDCEEVSHIYSQGGTILGTSNSGHFKMPLGEDVIQRCKEKYQEM